jgi:hypothetical protein
LWCATLGLAAACSTEPPAPTTIVVTPSGAISLTSLHQTLLLTARVLDQHGDTMPGQTVSFVSNNTAAVTVSAGGLLTALSNGTTTVTIASGSAIKDVPVTVTQTPSIVVRFGGDNQLGALGFPLNNPITAVVADGLFNPMAGVTVTFAVATGGGSVSPTAGVSDVQGKVSTNWTLGAAGAQSVSATAPGVAPAFFAAAPSAFQVTIVNIGAAFSAPVQAAFDSATAFWQRAIVGDLQDIANVSVLTGQCGNSSNVGPFTVDDVLVLARIDPIDGVGGVLGSAGPCFIRTAGGLTVVGAMLFDVADISGLVANSSLNAVIRHEMGHVLGFGTLWDQGFNCLQNPSNPPGTITDTYFNCAKGLAAFQAMGGGSYTGGQVVPVENCGPTSPAGCGAGTVNGHWREPTFFNEVMTGYLNSGVANPASRLTIASMEDLGYQVLYGAAESYTRVFTAPPVQRTAPLIDLSHDVMTMPLFAIDGSGRVTAVVRP